MNKNIIVCSDGTGNTAVKGRGTNVFKLFEAVDLNGHKTNKHLMAQVAIYDDGVGTEDFKPLKIFAGATGFGLARNVRQLYKALVRIYDPGDQIFLFGFSRGAFTVRTLGGLIARCGILNVEKLGTAEALEKAVDRTYSVYRKAYRTELAKLILGPPDLTVIANYRRDHCLPGEVPIHFIGVWDTVDAVGTPLRISDFINWAVHRFKFPDHELSTTVKRACHALSVDEPRQSFQPVLWNEKDDSVKQRITQVWFAGVHSNVGGGYPKQGMSLVPLDWMTWNAKQAGLRMIPEDARFYSEHANVDDKLYDPRAGMGIFYRWLPRDIAALCVKDHVQPAIHLSALERAAHGTEDYAPGNLPPGADVVITPLGDPERDRLSQARANRAKQVLRSAHDQHSRGSSLLDDVRGSVQMGRVSYWVYMASYLAIVIPLVLEGLRRWDSLANLPELLESWWFWCGWLLVGFAIAYTLTKVSDAHQSAFYSSFWHKAQPLLRKGLADARAHHRDDE